MPKQQKIKRKKNQKSRKLFFNISTDRVKKAHKELITPMKKPNKTKKVKAVKLIAIYARGLKQEPIYLYSNDIYRVKIIEIQPDKPKEITPFNSK